LARFRRWRVAERPVTTIRPAVNSHCSLIAWGGSSQPAA
jgi:hypothetical protein